MVRGGDARRALAVRRLHCRVPHTQAAAPAARGVRLRSCTVFFSKNAKAHARPALKRPKVCPHFARRKQIMINFVPPPEVRAQQRPRARNVSYSMARHQRRPHHAHLLLVATRCKPRGKSRSQLPRRHHVRSPHMLSPMLEPQSCLARRVGAMLIMACECQRRGVLGDHCGRIAEGARDTHEHV